jgi:hypothetical protein
MIFLQLDSYKLSFCFSFFFFFLNGTGLQSVGIKRLQVQLGEAWARAFSRCIVVLYSEAEFTDRKMIMMKWS